jgi:hypothetical protein
MQNLFNADYTRTDWVKRFAYRAMLCRNELDTASAMLIADTQFDGQRGSEPEAAAERFVGQSSRPLALPRLPYRNEPRVARRSSGVLAPQVSKVRVDAALMNAGLT